jgi:Putative metal-binding motif
MVRSGMVLLVGLTACVSVDTKSEDTEDGLVNTTLENPDTTTPPPVDPDADLDGFPASVDCDDANPAINPAAVEACDGIDNNCNTGVDDEFAATLEAVGTYATVDEAVSAAVIAAPTGYGTKLLAEGTITVCPGTWTVAPVAFEAGTLTLRSVTGRDTTTLAALDGATLLSVDDGAGLVVEGLTLTGAVGPAISVRGDSALSVLASRITANGQGLNVFGEDSQGGEVVGASVNLTDVEITSNIGGANGGGASLQGTFDASLTDVSVVDNVGNNGGGLYLATLFGPVSLTLVNLQVDGNVANADGGGIFTQLVPVVGDAGTQITGNTAAGKGGGVATKRALVSNLLLSGNDAAAGGGLAAIYDKFLSTAPSPDEMDAVIVDSNTADEGGGLWVDQNEILSLRSSCAVTLNTAEVRGGGAMLAGDDSYLFSDFADFGAAGVDDNTPDDLFVFSYGSLFFGNDASFACSTVSFCD